MLQFREDIKHRILDPDTQRLRGDAYQTPRAGFTDLPTEIVLEIATYLPDPNLLCLALTCKSLLNILDSSEELRRSSHFRHSTLGRPSGFYRRLQLKGPLANRWQLLECLEDSRWRFCSGCLRLHPIKDFSDTELRSPTWSRTCMLGKRAGVIRLCPCIEITFRDKIKLMQKLSTTPSPKVPLPTEQPTGCVKIHGVDLDFARPSPGTQEDHCHHTCSYAYDSEFLRVHSKLRFVLDQVEKKDFMVETEYTVVVKSPARSLPYPTVLLCPHRDIVYQISSIVRRQEFQSFRPYRGTNGIIWYATNESISCPWCSTIVTNARWCVLGPVPFKEIFCFTTRRSLGIAINEADDVWYRQTENAFAGWPRGEEFSEAYFEQLWAPSLV